MVAPVCEILRTDVLERVGVGDGVVNGVAICTGTESPFSFDTIAQNAYFTPGWSPVMTAENVPAVGASIRVPALIWSIVGMTGSTGRQ